MRNRAVVRWLAFGILLAAGGCSKSTPSSSSGAGSGSNPGASSGSGAGSAAGSGADPSSGDSGRVDPSKLTEMSVPQPPPPVVVDAGTILAVTLNQSISSKTNNEGDRFDALLAAPVNVDGKEILPAGAKVSGTVTLAHSAGRFQGHAALGVTLNSITVNGSKYAIQATSVENASKGRGKRTATGAGGGAVLGAIVGGLAGGGKGAAIGAGVGAGAGTAGAAYTGNRDITFPAETRLSFKLTQAVSVTPQ